jgi:hypothetical protein
MKLGPLDKHGWSQDGMEWIANPRCEDKGELEQKLIDRRDDIEVIGMVTDDEADYSYDEWALIKLDSDYYLLSTSGCSCPSPSETWYVNLGPATLAEIKNDIVNGDYDGYTLPKKQAGDFLALFDTAEKAS